MSRFTVIFCYYYKGNLEQLLSLYSNLLNSLTELHILMLQTGCVGQSLEQMSSKGKGGNAV